jgi:mono/diheme cytochrome c family protein
LIADSAWSADVETYADQIKPLLARRCFACHGVLKAESDLRLDSAAFIRKGGASGPAILPGKAIQSELVRRVQSEDLSQRMPPEGEPLSAEQIKQIAAWIDAGADAPADDQPEQHPRDHWAFRRPSRPLLSGTPSATAANPIDLFIEEGYRARGLTAVLRADRPTMLRRLSVDLVGLPPSPRELEQFQQDEKPDAYDRQIDRLLASPAHGERWGRHWMDVWRYSDWYGRRSVPDVMNSYPQIWRWRDWIVDSLNVDQGYDQMIVEMLAADESTPGDDQKVVATGYLVRNWFKWNYENWMKDNVEHTAKGFLGLTMNCCHCHDHKYDPISQEDYFRFRAFFEPLELRQDRVPGLPDPGPFKKYVYAEAYGPISAGLIRVFDEKPDAATYMYIKGDSRNRMADRAPVTAGVPGLFADVPWGLSTVSLPAEAYYPGLKSFVQEEERSKGRQAVASAQASIDEAVKSKATALAARQATLAALPMDLAKMTESQRQVMSAEHDHAIGQARLAEAERSLESLEARIRADMAKYKGVGDPAQTSRLAYQAERHAEYAKGLARAVAAEKAVWVASLKLQDNPAAPAELKTALESASKELADARSAVDAARLALGTKGETYAPLSPIYPATSTGRRLALARWITDRQNPLTARVGVNHLWMRHMGRGIVDTPSNFGRSGHKPSHPTLLDWLAVELMEENWQMKHLHRLVVSSETYRLSSNPPANDHPSVAQDRDNQFYWRANARPMEAEAVRDAVLASAEDLDRTMGGQELDASQGLSSRRRSLYFASHGEGKMLFLETFDAPDVCDGYQRSTSIRPQQALALSNSELTLRASQTLAESIWNEIDSAPANQLWIVFINKSFQRVLSRPPRPAEVQAALTYLERQALSPARSEDPASADAGAADRSARAGLIHALFNHHEFVTVR